MNGSTCSAPSWVRVLRHGRHLLIVLLVLAFAMACSGGDGRPVYGAATKSIETERGAAFVLRLEANSSTGYSWQITSLPAQVVLAAERFVPAASGAVGAAGVQEYTFRAIEPGRGALELRYVRAWEDPPVPAAQVSIAVDVAA